MYFPLSQITTNLTTQGGEFKLQSTGKEYIGDYFRTSKGNNYTGKVPNDGPNELLINFQSAEEQSQEDVEAGREGSYNEEANVILLPNDYLGSTSLQISPTIQSTTSIPFPTEQNYNSTKFKRYFLKKTNNFIYKEINSSTYELYINQDSSVPYSLYQAINIDWVIAGNLLSAFKTNFNIVELAEVENEWFGFVQSFKDRFAKFYKLNPNDTFYTKGGELKIKDTNIEYVGYFHVHPSRGVLMEGKQHIDQPHSVLTLIQEGDFLSNKITQVNEEVGTSRRRNIPRGSY